MEDREVVDPDGNTQLHGLIKQDADIDVICRFAEESPHQLFILNKSGQTPLDIYLEDEQIFNLDSTLEEQDHETAGAAKVTFETKKNVPNYRKQKRGGSSRQFGKVIDLHQVDPEIQLRKQMETRRKHQDWFYKSLNLVSMMNNYHAKCSFRFLR